MNPEEREHVPSCRDLRWLASQRGRQESRTLTIRGIWTVGDGGEEPITSAKAERERKAQGMAKGPAVHLQVVSLRGSLQVKLGTKARLRPGRTLSTKHSPEATLSICPECRGAAEGL